MKADDFSKLVELFFVEHLSQQRNLSSHTIAAYRDTFHLLLRFLSTRLRKPIDALSLAALSPEAVLAFLDHLETERKNSVRTRNQRLAALRSFARFVISRAPTIFFATGQQILAIPLKRHAKPVLGFMTREEIDAVLGAAHGPTWSNRRDHLLFSVLYNTGARISEALQLRPQDVRDRAVQLHGKGRKARSVPLWPATVRQIQQWCSSNQLRPEELLFQNRRDQTLTRQGAAFRFALALRRAAQACPTLRGRKITLHSVRHSTAMGLLQAGVALEVISLWLGHNHPSTTHGYIEADMKMKAAALRRLHEPSGSKRQHRQEPSRVLAFLRAL